MSFNIMSDPNLNFCSNLKNYFQNEKSLSYYFNFNVKKISQPLFFIIYNCSFLSFYLEFLIFKLHLLKIFLNSDNHLKVD